MENKQELKVARSISPTDTGFVTADMLYEYLAANSSNITGGAVTWDVDSINLRCNGRSVLSATSSGGVTLGAATTTTNVLGNKLKAAGTTTDVSSTQAMNISAGHAINVGAGSGITLETNGTAAMRATSIELFGEYTARLHTAGKYESAGITIEGYKIGLRATEISQYR